MRALSILRVILAALPVLVAPALVRVPVARAADSPRTTEAMDLMKKAMVLHKQDKSHEALPLVEQAMPAIDEASSSGDPILYANINMLAADVYEAALLKVRAEARFKKSLELAEKKHGKTSPAIVPWALRLGKFYMGEAEPERAAAFLERGAQIALASDDASAKAEAAGALADLASGRRRYVEAERLRARQVELLTEAGASEFNVMVARFGLAHALADQGRAAEAEKIYANLYLNLRMRAMIQPTLTPALGVLASGIALHYRVQGKWEAAREFAGDALAIAKKIHDPESLAMADTECLVGEIAWASGDLAGSLDPVGHCFDARERMLAPVLATGSEEQKRASMATYLIAFEKTMTAQALAGSTNERLTKLAYTQVLRSKGRVLDALTEQALMLRGASGETRALAQKLAAVRTHAATVASAGLDPAKIKALEEESRDLEKRLAESSEAFKRAMVPISVSAVQAALPAGAALVDLVAYRPLRPDYRTLADAAALSYLAYVVTKEGAPRVVDLGAAAPIDRLAVSLRATLGDPHADAASSSRALYGALFSKLEPHLGGITQLIVAPDGALGTVPFGALVDEQGRALVDRFTITYATSGHDLVRSASAPRSSSGEVVVFANPKFDLGGGGSPKGGGVLARASFPPLPGTAAEARGIQHTIPGARVYTGEDASESRAKGLSHPAIVHFATHGFFLGTPRVNLVDQRGLVLDTTAAKRSVKSAVDPMLRSGLALAGATGLHGSGGEDGVLTAREASDLDLSGTKLVVMSACQTGEGEAQNGEGIRGLRRALATAGAETLVMSLWPVDDEATSYLMQSYYQKLKAGRGRSEALREAQQELKKNGPTRHPYFWAAFIVSGNPGPVEIPSSALKAAEEAPRVEVKAESPKEEAPVVVSSPSRAGIGVQLGAGSFALAPRAAGAAERSGITPYLGVELPLLLLVKPDLGGRGAVLWDRLAVRAAIPDTTFSGDKMGLLSLEYTLLLGVRGESFALLGGARLGTGTLATSGPDVQSAGGYLPLEARLELQISAALRPALHGYAFNLSGPRAVKGLELRIPLGGFWLQGAYASFESTDSHPASATLASLGLGKTF